MGRHPTNGVPSKSNQLGNVVPGRLNVVLTFAEEEFTHTSQGTIPLDLDPQIFTSG